MKGRPVDQLVYAYMFPRPRQSDPQDFRALLDRYLITEVRQETHAFYGHLDTPEAKYPGLDYTHSIHRVRLSRWPWHRRLFRAFDGLRLTHAEITGLTKWEGTKWAKERFERDQGIRIRDTTADGFPNYVDPDDPYSAQSLRAQSEETEDPLAAEEGPAGGVNEEEDDDDDDDDDDDESDEELESVGVALNERLRQRVAMRDISGDTSMPLDEEWENWLKHAIESGELPYVADQIARFQGPHNRLTADDIFPPRMMAAARAGAWDAIPDFLHDMIRRGLQSARRPAQASISPAAATAAAAAAASTAARPSLARPSIRYSNVLNTLSRVAVYAQDQQADPSEVRPPQQQQSTRRRSSTRTQQTAQPGA